MNTERKTKNPGSLVEKIATGKANALEIDHDDLLIGKFIFIRVTRTLGTFRSELSGLEPTYCPLSL